MEMEPPLMNQRYLRRRIRSRHIAAGLALTLSSLIPQSTAWAQSRSVAQPTWTEAARQTLSTGATTVLVVTSSAVPGSRELFRSLATNPSLLKLRGRVIVAELSADDDPAQVQRLKVSSPSLVAFTRSPSGALERAATSRVKLGPAELVRWLGDRGLIPSMGASQVASRDADPAVVRTGFGHHQGAQPSPQTPYYATPQQVYVAPPQQIYVTPPAAPPREVMVERPVERRVIRRVVPQPREVIVEREVVVEREAPAPRRVVREIEVEESNPRSVLTRPREAVPREREVIVEREAPAPRRIVREVAPRDIEEVVEEVVEEVEVAAPREVVVAREAAPRAVRVTREAPQPRLALIQPGPLGRIAGRLGNRLRQHGMPRVNVEVETERTYRMAAPAETERLIAAPAPREVAPAYMTAPPPVYAPAPVYQVPSPQMTPYLPSPQSQN
jgi:hypothetical protein